MINLLIVGGNGFLGSQILKILDLTKFNVTSLDISLPKETLNGIEYIHSSLEAYIENKLYLNSRIDVIFNVSASLPYKSKEEDFKKNNIEGARNICLLFEFFDNPKVLHVSSSGVYGLPLDVPIKSSTKFNPQDDYAKSKILAEFILESSIPEDKLTIIRPRTIVGVGRDGIFKILLFLVRNRIPIPIPQGGKQILQFVHVKDLARLIVFMMENSVTGTWPAGGPNPKSLLTELRNLASQGGLNLRYFPIKTNVFVFIGNLMISMR